MSGAIPLRPSVCHYGMDMAKFTFKLYILLVMLILLLFSYILIVTRLSSSGTECRVERINILV
jgi:hypothetical protein